MSYNAQITRLNHVRKHPQADRLQLATVQGCQIVVGAEASNGDLGIYFPTDGILSRVFCETNDLFRRVDETGKNVGGMFDIHSSGGGRVRTQKFRGEVSDGFWIPVSALYQFSKNPLSNAAFEAMADAGYEFTSWEGVEICGKFVPAYAKTPGSPNPGKKSLRQRCKMFHEHINTLQLGTHYNNLPLDAQYIWTEKVHGTSHRVGHLLIDRDLSWVEKLLMKLKVNIQTQEWGYISGTRRVVLDKSYQRNTGYHSDGMRDIAVMPFIDSLRKGETVYFEIVGFDPVNGGSIMPAANLDRLTKIDPVEYKDYKLLYSNHDDNHMTFKYGCSDERMLRIFVYRITMTDVDGHSYDYSWNDVVERCKQLEVDPVPTLGTAYRSSDAFESMTSEDVLNLSIDYSTGPSVVDNSHFKEGVCLRIDKTGFEPCVMKYKSVAFKIVEGIIKDSGIIDEEEIQSEECTSETAL